MKGLDFFIKKTVIGILGGTLVLSFYAPPSFGQSESEPSEDRECTLRIETILQGISEEQPGKLRARLSFEEGFSVQGAELYLYGRGVGGVL